MTSAINLKVENLGHYYDSPETWILKNICFELQSTQSLGIIGPNGGGKSTLLKSIAGIIKPTLGEITRTGIKRTSYLPQENLLNTLLPLTVYDILEFAFLGDSPSSISAPHKKELILNAMTKVELVGLSDAIYSSLSGGQKQRVFLAKLYLECPTLLILDEPTKGLDSNAQDILLKTIENLKKEWGTIVIIVDHNINQVIKHCDKVLCLNKTTHWHDKKELLNPKIIEHIYHCELEHLLIHESDKFTGASYPHEECSKDGNDGHHH